MNSNGPFTLAISAAILAVSGDSKKTIAAESYSGDLEIAAKIASVNGPLEFIRQLADITIG